MPTITVNGFQIPLKGSLGTEFPNFADLMVAIHATVLSNKKSTAPLDIFIPEDGTIYFTASGVDILDGDFKANLDNGSLVQYVRRSGEWVEYQRDAEDGTRIDRTFNGKFTSFHTAQSEGDDCEVVVTNTNSQSRIAGRVYAMTVADLDPNESAVGVFIAIDDDASSLTADSSSVVAGIGIAVSGEKAAQRHAINIFPGFDRAFTVNGADAIPLTAGYVYNTVTVEDETTSLNTIGVDVPFMTVNNATVLIGGANPFPLIEVVLASIGSQDSDLEFRYSTGNDTWANLAVLGEGTSGFQKISGQIIFAAPPGWATSNLYFGSATTSAFYIEIKRTRVGGMTAPIESRFRIFESTITSSYILRGDGTVQPVHKSDVVAPNDSQYYSIDAGKLVYKDPGGTVNELY